MKKPVLVFFLIVFLLPVIPAGAEIYKYIDENGQQRWTDDLGQVPKEQRAAVQQIESVEETATDTESESETGVLPELPMEHPMESQDVDVSGKTADLTREALEKERAELDAQYQQLAEEGAAIEQMKTEALDAKAQTALNARISAYNRKRELYESQLSAFNKKIMSYNQKIMPEPAPQSE